VEHRGDGSRGWGGTSPATVRNAILVMLFSCCRMRGCGGLSGLAQIFVANMTGNTVLPGLALGQAKVQAALRAVVALAGFVAASVRKPRSSGGVENAPPGRPRRIRGRMVPCRGRTGRKVYHLIVLPTLAMGIQSAAVRRLGIPGVATTYITGTLTNLTQVAIARRSQTQCPTMTAPSGRRHRRPAWCFRPTCSSPTA
jgi:hypothetical protein